MASSYLIICLAGAAFACLAVAMAAWPRRDDPTIAAFLLLATGAGMWCAGRVMEVNAADLPSRILWAKLQYLGIMVVPLGWLLAMVRLARPQWAIARWWTSLALAFTVTTLALVFTNESHGLIWRSVQLVDSGIGPGGLRAVFRHGPAYWVAFAYCYLLLLASVPFLLTARNPYLTANARRLLGAGLLLPLCAQLAYLRGWTAALGGDLTPATFSAMAVLVWFCALRPHLDDVGHYARLRVFDALREGCVIVGADGLIVDANPAARRLLPEIARGQRAPDGWLGASPAVAEGAHYELTVEPVRNLDAKPIGQLVFLRDVSGYRTRERALVQENSSLAVRLNETAEKLTRIEGDLYRDPLTGLLNRRFFQRETAALVNEAFERQMRIGLVLVDIDYFKQFNDIYGHVLGDECLRRVATAIAETVQGPHEFAARVGGEEFAIVLPSATPAHTRAAGLRVVRAVRNLALAHAGASPGHPFVTASVGAICETPATPMFEPLVAMADAAMYAAKRGGRDRFVMGGQHSRLAAGSAPFTVDS